MYTQHFGHCKPVYLAPKTGTLSWFFVLMRDCVRWLTAKYVPLEEKKTAIYGQYLTPTLGRVWQPALLVHSALKIKSASRDDRKSLHPPSPSFMFMHEVPWHTPRNTKDRFAILEKKHYNVITCFFSVCLFWRMISSVLILATSIIILLYIR